MTLRQEHRLSLKLEIIRKLTRWTYGLPAARDLIDNDNHEERNALRELVKLKCVRSWKERTHGRHWRRVYQITELGKVWYEGEHQMCSVSIATHF